MFLLDTNIVSELVKKIPNAKVLARLNAEPPSDLFICSVNIFELRFGAARSAKPASLWARIERDIVGRFQVLPIETNDGLAAADIMSVLAGSGKNAALQDILLAGVAVQRNLTMVTRNRRHFDHILNLTVENWFD